MAHLDQLIRMALAASPARHRLDADTLHRLDEMEAFTGQPALRFILATALRNGTLDRFAACGEWNDAAHAEISRLIAHTGLQPHLVENAFDAYARAMKWVPHMPGSQRAYASEPPITYGEDTDQTPGTAPSGIHIIINREKEPYRGITAENPAVADATPAKITVTATLRRTSAFGSGALCYALRDANGTLISSGNLATMNVTAPSILPVTASIPVHGIPATLTLYIC